MNNHNIEGVIYKEEEWIIAQLLQHDINAQAKTMEELKKALTATVFAELKDRDGSLSKIPPAPNRFFEMYQSGKGKVNCLKKKEDEIAVELSLRKVA